MVAALVAFPIGTAHAQEPVAGVLVDSVEVRGNERQSADAVRAEAGIHAGQRVALRDIQRAMKRLWATGQYSDVKVYAGGTPADTAQPMTLIIEVAEQPYVTAIEFNGLEHVSGGTVRDTVGLRAGAPLQPGKVAAATSMIRRLLADKGFQVRSLKHRLEPVEAQPGSYRLVFDVEEGHRVAIAEVVFEGNEAFDDGRLRKVMGTKPEGFFWFRSGTYDEEKLRTDLREKLPEFYGEHGYIDLQVLGDTLVVDPVSGKARLVVRLDEGTRYDLVAFEVRGNRRFATQDLERYFQQERGGILAGLGFGRKGNDSERTVFDRAAFMKATEQVAQLYRNQGYLYAQVEPVIERVQTEDGRPGVHVAWEIREGEPAYVNRVIIAGNTFTHEDVIRERVYLLPGDVYNEELLIQSYRSITGLGFFETPGPTPQIEPTETGDVDITFEVKEKQTGSVNFGTAIGGLAGVSGFLGYDQPNLFGQAKSGHLRWEFGQYANNFEASYTDPALFGSRVSGSISLFDARNNFNRFFSFSEGAQRRTGAGLNVGLPLPHDRWSRLSLGYSLARVTYDDESGGRTSVFAEPPGVQSTISIGLLRNTLNHPIFPTAGTSHKLQAELSGGPLGGDGDFQKYTASGSWWVPVGQLGGGSPGSRPILFALGLSAEGGAIFGAESSLERFPFERFWMGGVQFGRPLRGYEETTITPTGYHRSGTVPLEERFGDAYMRLSAEYAVRVNDNLSLSAFYDAGRVWRRPSDVNPTRLLRGAGIGAVLVTPFGPLGLDYAYGFDKDKPGWQLHFKMGSGL